MTKPKRTMSKYEREYYDGDWGDSKALFEHNLIEALSEIAHYLKMITELLEIKEEEQ